MLSLVGERNGHGRAAKKRSKLLAFSARYLSEGDTETCERYIQLASDIEARLREAKACIACGRPLKNEDSLKLGYGEECAANLEKESNVDR